MYEAFIHFVDSHPINPSRKVKNMKKYNRSRKAQERRERTADEYTKELNIIRSRCNHA